MSASFRFRDRALADGRTEVFLTGLDEEGTEQTVRGAHFVARKAREQAEAAAAIAGLAPFEEEAPA